ncbi:hypothetical protein [Cellulomonas sp. ES6]|uniref:hypothetical protein n=1 Tax=Cellulomonas sp. ES6 TaxID=3039384 RepID=UPI0024B78FAA|nr:hypothetical protein [Cellulomonas sp. ES6]WHP18821.1 hypothetical protein P9841_06810 [Cellulomonas sp. ES6]
MTSTTDHQHEWTETTGPEDTSRTWACTQCPATTTQCATCDRTLDTTGRVCEHCVSRSRNDLREIRDLYALLPDVIAAAAGLHAVRYDMRFGAGEPRHATDAAIIGGAAMVMAAGGNVDKTRLGRGETTIDPALLEAERKDPPSVRAVLTFWEEAWRDEQHQDGPTTTALADTVDYLLANTTWAAQHAQTWTEYRGDVRDLIGRLRYITGASKAPVRNEVPCPECGGTVLQRWTDAGLDDAHTCTGCRITWPTAAHFARALRTTYHALPETNPDALITLDDARRILPDLKRNTLNVWIKRDRERAELGAERELPERGRDVRGENLYRLGDIAARLDRNAG